SVTPISSGVVSIYMRVPSGTVNVQLGDPLGSPYGTKTLTTTWQRFSTVDTGSLGGIAIYNSQSGTTITIEVSAAQVEQGSYATSYIPTSGSAVTRVGDACNNGANAQVINSTEGVLYAEIAALANDGTNRFISLTNGVTDATNISLAFTTTTNQIRALVDIGYSLQASITHTVSSVLDFNKVAFKFKENDFALWINGVKVGTDLNGSVPPANYLSDLGFLRINALSFYGKCKDSRVYTTALTDAELQALTTI
ncbi:MAG: hypothetical protein H8E16_21715, partial [Flavobacteriales bacterium]|nr:hypothetical protein [Flavobacteriales bacterium]